MFHDKRTDRPDRINAGEENVEPQVELETVDWEGVAEISLNCQTLPGIEDVSVAGVFPLDIDQSPVQHLLRLRHQADPVTAHLTGRLHYPDTAGRPLHLNTITPSGQNQSKLQL